MLVKTEVGSCFMCTGTELWEIPNLESESFFLLSFSDTLVFSVWCSCSSYRALDTYSLARSDKTCYSNKFSHQCCMELGVLV